MVKFSYVEPILLGYMFCMWTSYSLEQQLIYRKTCVQQFNSTYCEILYKTKNETFKGDQDFVQKKTSQWAIYNSIVRAVPSIVTTLVSVVWLDRFGRKPILVLPLIGGVIISISYIVNSYYVELSIFWLFFGSFLDGLCGQFALIIAVSFSYLADTTLPEQRTRRTILLESMSFTGGLISEITSGLLLQYYGFLPPFILMLSVYVFTIVYWFFLKESYTPDQEVEKQSFYQELKEKLVKEAYRMVLKQNDSKKHKRVILLLASFLLGIFLMVGGISVSVLYILRAPINFSPSNIGFFFAELHGLKTIGSWLGNLLILRLLGWSDNSTLSIYCFTSIGFFLSMAFSNTSNHVYLSGAWSLGMGLGVSTIRGKLSKMMGKTEQGVLFSILACSEVVITLAASSSSNAIYKATVDTSPNTIYFVFTGIATFTSLLVGYVVYLDKTDSYDPLKEEAVTINSQE